VDILLALDANVAAIALAKALMTNRARLRRLLPRHLLRRWHQLWLLRHLLWRHLLMLRRHLLLFECIIRCNYAAT
jgi:hypothetical protein